MALHDTDLSLPPRLRQRIDQFFAGLGQGFNAYIERRSRMDEIEALNALSDEDLLKRGIRRDDIPRYVFRDITGV